MFDMAPPGIHAQAKLFPRRVAPQDIAGDVLKNRSRSGRKFTLNKVCQSKTCQLWWIICGRRDPRCLDHRRRSKIIAPPYPFCCQALLCAEICAIPANAKQFEVDRILRRLRTERK